jgi:CRISPR-associated protein Cmr2
MSDLDDSSKEHDAVMPPQQFLLGVSLPGVQRFIVSSRKTADLWGASQIRQELAHLVYTTVTETAPNTRFVIPSGSVSVRSMTNRLVAVIDHDFGFELTRRIEVAVSERWAVMVEEAYRSARGSGKLFTPELPIVCCIVPYIQSEHKKGWRELQRALTAKRRVRSFAAINQTGSRLCGQCAEYQVCPTENLPNRSGSEELCVSCITKRVRGSESTFPSTSTISAAPFLRTLANGAIASPQIASLVAEVQRLHQTLGAPTVPDSGYADPSLIHSLKGSRALDGSWWYLSSWERERLCADNPFLAKRPAADLDAICVSARSSLQQLFALLGDEPHGSYAIIAMDGDKVGLHISSKKSLAEVDEVAQGLTKFASTANVVAESFLGRVVYSGGDDLLILVPVEHALALVEKLETDFRRDIPALTISSAVHVVPRSAPLMAALSTVRETLEWAKAIRPATGLEGRLGISVDVRSGARGRLAIVPQSAASFSRVCALVSSENASKKLAGSLETQARLFDTDVTVGLFDLTRPQYTWLPKDCIDQVALLAVSRQTNSHPVALELFSCLRDFVEAGSSFGAAEGHPERQRLGCFAAIVDIASLFISGVPR